ncbi:MAG: DNA polymerase domain-containing protein [Bacteroidota bacterium]
MSRTTTITGWLFDLYPSARGITLWLVDRDGRKYCCHDAFVPSFFMHVAEEEEERVSAIVRQFPFRVGLDRTMRREIYTNEEWNVLRVSVHDTMHLKDVVRRLERHFPHFVFFDSDIPSQQLYLYRTKLFPLAYGEYAIDGDGALVEWRLDDDPAAMEYAMPPLITMTLKNRPDFVSPKYRKTYQLEVGYDDRTYGLESEEPAEVLAALNRHLERCDPDIIMTEYGDAILLPLLVRYATQEEVPLSLNRDPTAGYFTTNETSYFAYGKIVHKDGAFELAGRWHLDTENSFMMGESSLDGVAEIARLTQLPVQHQSRATIGSALSSMQLSWAYRNGYLIPAKKREPEEFKSASTLLLADRGGLIFQPVMGFHERIAEMDFVSMYPTIMVEHNVSPETVNCRCCNNRAVPELGYTICERREGIVPATLRTIVSKRSAYKKMKRSLKRAGDERWHLYDRRQNALKWMLVTCFGYLGYKNARFGRIEAHESVNAFSREAILRAKEIAEAQGYHVIHAIVDCMWLEKPGATEADYNALAAEVRASVGIDISLEGIYNWILFPASKMDPHIPTANRYVGWYDNDEIKIRGIEVRRHDTPVFIKRMQGEMLKIFGGAKDVAGVERLVPEALAKAGEFVAALRAGQVDPLELVVRRHLSREVEEYTTNTANAAAAKALDETGVRLAPGEMVEYVIVDMSGKKKPMKAIPVALYSVDEGYDIEAYTELVLKAVETLLLPFGYDVARLRQVFACEPPKKKLRPKVETRLQVELFLH